LEAEIRGCFFLLDAASLVTAEATGRLRLFSVPDLKEQTSLDMGLPILCGDLAPSGAQLALGGADGKIHFVAVDGFDRAPLVVTATRTSRRTATPLQRLLGKSRMVPAYSCTCPACRQSFELLGKNFTSQTLCPRCRRQLRISVG
jgi:WD40 repeat protein